MDGAACANDAEGTSDDETVAKAGNIEGGDGAKAGNVEGGDGVKSVDSVVSVGNNVEDGDGRT
jgi:hypothetical protein